MIATTSDYQNTTTTTSSDFSVWRVVDANGRTIARGGSIQTTTNYSSTGEHVLRVPEIVVSDYYTYNAGPFSDIDRTIRDFRKAVSSRAAMFLAWSKAAREEQFKSLLQGVPLVNPGLQRFCYGRERRKMPTRELFKKRVCGGHQRYRVMVT